MPALRNLLRSAAGLALAAALAGFAPVLPATAQTRCADVVPGPKPQNASRDFVGQGLDEIVARGFITIAVYDDFRPFSWLDGETPKGVDVDLGRIIAEALGVEARFVMVEAGENLDADLRYHVWQGDPVDRRVSNVMMHVPYDSAFACRVEQVTFTGQYFDEQIAVAYHPGDYPEKPPVPAYFRFDPVAVQNDSLSDFYLSGMANGSLVPMMHRYRDAEAQMAALAAGEVKAAMGPRAELEAFRTGDIVVAETLLPGLAKADWTLGVGVHFSHKPLSYAIDDAIAAALADGRIAAIFEAYGLTFTPPER